MRFDIVSVIFRKEVLDLVRDRRTLISMVVVPLLVMPILMIVATRLIERISIGAREEARKSGIAVLVKNPDLRAVVEKSGMTILDKPDFKDAIEKKQITAAVEESTGPDGKPVILIHVDRSNPTSSASGDQLRALFDTYREAQIRASLESRGVPASLLSPFTIRRENVAGERKMAGAAWGSMLGYVLLLLMFTGGMYPVIDMTAGEKERKTLEMFLSSPAQRGEIVVGKILAAVTAIFTTAILTLGSMVVSLKNAGGSEQMQKMLGTIPLDTQSVLLIAVTLLPLSIFAAASMIAIALFAKSFKEGQSYLTPLMIVVIFPALLGGLPGMQLTPALALVPIFNVSQLLRGILVGDFSPLIFGITTAANLTYAAVAFVIARRTFNDESVLFRS
jgi:sodium transport system permease protein